MAKGDSPWVLFFTLVLSHATIAPAMVQFVRRRWTYEFCIATFSLITSVMYHTCETFDVTIFMNELQWHRLDNVLALANFGALFTYLACIPSPTANSTVKYLCFLVGLVLQEPDPWNFAYTGIPIFVMALIPILHHALVLRRRPDFDLRNAAMGCGLFGLGAVGFARGLDDETDPVRIFHGCWHIFGGIGAFFLWRIVRNPTNTLVQQRLGTLAKELPLD